MDEAALLRLEQLAAAATKGPWTFDGRALTSPHRGKRFQQVGSVGLEGCQLAQVDRRNGEFIAAARAAVPELVRALREQQAENARLRAVIRGEIAKWEASWDLKDATCEEGDPAPFECAHCYALTQIEELSAVLEAAG